MIPDFNDDGELPPGIHPATLEEFEERFAIFDHSDRRLRLFEHLQRLINDARQTRLVMHLFVVGSFITAKQEPNDFDCVLALDPQLISTPLRPFEYNLVSRTMSRRIYRGDVFAERDGSPDLAELLSFFQHTRDGTETGIVEVAL